MENRLLALLRPALHLAPCLALFATLFAQLPARAEPVDPAWATQVLEWARDQAAGGAQREGARVEVEVGRLDPRLRLAPCGRIEPYLPTGSRPWGRTRVGLRCVDGMARWNVYLPVTVRLWASAPVLREPRPAGHELQDGDLVERDADWAERRELPLVDAGLMLGRTLARPLGAGQAVRPDDLQQRQWFAAGDTVRVIARGRGYSVSGEGQALTRGLEGQHARVRTVSGRIVTGVAVAQNRVEIPL